MSDKIFVDSNVSLYALEEGAGAKTEAASAWLRYLLLHASGSANLQVMNEVANVLIKRSRLEPERIFSIVDGFALFGTTPIGEQTVAAARVLHFETGYSWWDCLLLASAMELGCRFFLSEDLHDGHRVRGLTIMSPFRHSPPQAPLH